MLCFELSDIFENEQHQYVVHHDKYQYGSL